MTRPLFGEFDAAISRPDTQKPLKSGTFRVRAFVWCSSETQHEVISRIIRFKQALYV
jgi:hypothetical protein